MKSALSSTHLLAMMLLGAGVLISTSHAQNLQTLQATGNTVLSGKVTPREAFPLNGLDVHYTSKDIDNGRMRRDGTQTEPDGSFSMTIWPGILTINILHQVSPPAAGGPEVWLTGYAQTIIALNSNKTVKLTPPIRVIQTSVAPEKLTSKGRPRVRVATIELVRFVIPASDSFGPSRSDGQEQQHGNNHVAGSIVDANGQLIDKVSIHVVSSKTGGTLRQRLSKLGVHLYLCRKTVLHYSSISKPRVIPRGHCCCMGVTALRNCTTKTANGSLSPFALS